MVVTRVIATVDPARAASASAGGDVGIALYHTGQPALAGLGHQLLDAVRQLPGVPSNQAWDFLSLALAVFGADRFVLRRCAADGWTRVIALEVDVVDPGTWEPVAETLNLALRFLTGDIWYLQFRHGGLVTPLFNPSLTDRDCACLFSGGLDSLIGAADLVTEGRRPLLVSQGSPKEVKPQQYLAGQIGLAGQHFDGRVREKFAPPYEPSARARSILFIGYGLLAATSLPQAGRMRTELFIPENGLIAINPPLTRRRIGSLSTRTTHPFFLRLLQQTLDGVGMGVVLRDSYCGITKGEMIAGCRNTAALRHLANSYSCGKGKRLNKHCGRCVPCLIRRAAFHKSGMADHTLYATTDLGHSSAHDDVFAVRMATAAMRQRNIEQWAAESGPLPEESTERSIRVNAVRRGLEELRDYLATITWR